jgi:rRNA maturation protein Nop10
MVHRGWWWQHQGLKDRQCRVGLLKGEMTLLVPKLYSVSDRWMKYRYIELAEWYWSGQLNCLVKIPSQCNCVHRLGLKKYHLNRDTAWVVGKYPSYSGIKGKYLPVHAHGGLLRLIHTCHAVTLLCCAALIHTCHAAPCHSPSVPCPSWKSAW